uniref:Uncharacterized protein n=1 Tax=Sphaerodactylus townsendi TaxID=933632 RepID=A0ACB8FQU2_9SAUR
MFCFAEVSAFAYMVMVNAAVFQILEIILLYGKVHDCIELRKNRYLPCANISLSCIMKRRKRVQMFALALLLCHSQQPKRTCTNRQWWDPKILVTVSLGGGIQTVA